MNGNPFGRPSTVLSRSGPPVYTGVTLGISTQSVPIALMWGTRRLTPMIVWMNGIAVDPTTIANGFYNPFQQDQVDAQEGGPTDRRSFVDDSGATDNVDGTGGTGYSVDGTRIQKTPGTKYFGIGTGPVMGEIDYLKLPNGGEFDGSTDVTSDDAHWLMPAIFALCEGPVNSVQRVWNGTGQLPISVTWNANTVNTVSAKKANTPRLLYYTLFPGDQAQTAWGYFASYNTAYAAFPAFLNIIANQDLAYRTVAYIASALVDCGHSSNGYLPKPPTQSFEVVRTPITTTGATQVDSANIGVDYAEIAP